MAKRRCGNFEGSFGRKMPATLAAFGLAFTLALTGCGDNDNGNREGGGQGAHLGDTLSLSGQVWTENWTDDGMELTQFTGNRVVTAGDSLSGTGGITNGQFNFSVASPTTAQQLRPISEIFDWLEPSFDNMQIGNANAVYLQLEVPNGELVRGYFSFSETATDVRWIDYFVTFIFVDRNVTISGRGATRTFPGGCDCEEWDGDCFCEEWDGECWCDSLPGTVTTSNFNITLREGWNAVRARFEWRETETSWSETIALSHENPGMPIRWILWEGSGFSANLSENLEPAGRTPLGRLPERAGALRSRR